MAPTALVEQPVADLPVFRYDNPSKTIFPDGIKTSGQTYPEYDQLKSYEEFPQEITGETVWKAEDYQNNPERWVHRFSEEEIAEVSKAADDFLASGTPMTGITKAKFPLPNMAHFLEPMRKEILNGKGFILFKGFPVQEWGNHKSAVAYMGLGTYLGYFVSQNGLGHVLGHVKDTGADPTQIDKVRIYRTTARQFFHADDCDIVGLLCIAKSLEGGESDIVSVHHVFNTLQKERPDVVKTLCTPNWYFDRKGEVSVGQEPYTKQPVFYIETGKDGRVYCKWDPYYVKSLTRFSDKGIIPALSPEQAEAAQVLEDTCMRLSLHMILDIGDIQFLSNAHVLHSRTAYKDYPPPHPRRHLMRLWLATPEDEGGWRLPFADSKHKKRGGVQVNDTPPKAPIDAE
ncbi:hypothetical protein CB0940_05671 [Cercospora beticola]|uniref:TauD/TfdA-like domain-containing protein n=1 Tax=Cercospora beticola TaxID=122368 RepID=A0A2G5HY02_CERBT|nr:hypothetical protein CB0940_05671 [Cercospora beticola]PIA97408.1 hypothetical protein CB0940_05671 [Cercospora beticola]WPA98241.1 hypothetical protein RHO25_002853 [Cercospora beticola]CAK1359468.1 unnamed protein product [Cercospora beticola]